MKNRYALLLVLGALNITPLNARNFTLPLYPEGEIPNYRDVGEREEWTSEDIIRVGKVQTPDIQVFLPSKRLATGDAVIICPGGGYWILAYDLEGTDIAAQFVARGIAAVVLKYRLPTSEAQIVPHMSPLMDAKRAMRLVRHHAAEWNIDPQRIGVMGFSAGGHLAATLSVHYDEGDPGAADPVERYSSRPDFSMLIYAVTGLRPPYRDIDKGMGLLQETNTAELRDYYHTVDHINAHTPPAILIHAADDKGVSYHNAYGYFDKLQQHDVTSELHIYAGGGHGFGLGLDRPAVHGWLERCIEWLQRLESP